MAFTEQEKGRIAHHLWYPRWGQLAQGIALGLPQAQQPLYILEGAFNRLLPEGEASCREDLCQLEDIERQMGSARGRLRVSAIAEVKMNDKELMQLTGEYTRWQRKLADDLGAPINPYSEQANSGQGGAGGGFNAPVGGGGW